MKFRSLITALLILIVIVLALFPTMISFAEESSVSNANEEMDTYRMDSYIKAFNTDAGDRFGFAVALDGNTLVVGAPYEDSSSSGVNGNGSDNSLMDAGAVYVFVYTDNRWEQQAYLKASNPDAFDSFGWSIAISNNILIVGSPQEDSSSSSINGNQLDNSAPNSGAAYIFERVGSVWTQRAYLKPSNNTPEVHPFSGDQFGWSTSINGNTIVVGAFGESSNAVGVNNNQSDRSAPNAGAAYVFVLDNEIWSQQAYLKASNTDLGDWFGRSVSIAGDTIAIGAPGEDSNALGINGDQSNNSQESSGALYVFVRSGGSWSQQTYIKPSNFSFGAQFGTSVAISDDTIATGAIGEFGADGAAYIFTRTGIQWSEDGHFSGPERYNRFGNSVALYDRLLTVGYAWQGSYLNGSAYLFEQNTQNWGEIAYFQAPYRGERDEFGSSVAIDNGFIIIGASGENSGATGINGSLVDASAPGAGAVYAYTNLPPMLPTCKTGEQEAENGLLFAPFITGNDSTSSGGKYIYAPEGAGNYYTLPVTAYKAEYCFNIPSSGIYRIKTNVYGTVGSSSFYVAVDGAPASGYLWDALVNTTYATDYVNDRGKADPVEVALTEGQHIVTFYVRTDGTRLDTVALEKVAELPPTPTCAGLLQEAEKGVTSGNFTTANDTSASNGQYIYTPEGSGHFWNGPSSQHKTTYCFNVDTAGTYRIKGKVYGADTLSDSFYVQVDGAPSNGYLWDVLPNTTYASDLVSDRNVADPVEILLSSGQHTVTVYAREDGTRLDTIELQLIDTGVDPIPTCAGLTQEAESGAPVGNFVVATDATASNGKFIHTPNGIGDFWNGPNSRQKAIYCFNVATAGTYRIDGKVLGADTLSDSFYVQVDGEPASGYLWDVKSGTSYTLDSVNDRNKADPVLVTLASGQHTVTVYAREDGTRLDTISLVPTTPSPQSRAIPPIAQGIHGTLRINATGLTQEIDFTRITVSVVDAESKGQNFSQQVQADRFGQFHFDGMMPGQYVVQLALPDGLRATVSEVTVTATAEEASDASFDLALQPEQEEGGNKTYLPLINR